MAINVNHVLKLGQAQSMFTAFATKADARFRKVSDKIAKTDLAEALVTELEGKANSADLGALAAKDEVAESDLASALATKINGKAEQSVLDILIGSDANKSARTIANEELAAQLIPEHAKEALDTLQEIAAWIQNHPDEAAAINAKLTLGTHEVEGQQVQYATVKDYVEAVMSAAALTAGNGIDITSGVVSAVVAAANGLSLGANGIALALASTTESGAMSAADKAKLDDADVTAYTGSGAVDITNHVVSVNAATQSAAGTMSAADKTKLDGMELATDAEVQEVIDGIWAS